MNTVEISRLSKEQRPKFVGNYFATLVLYDLVRQWVAKPGPFVWDRLHWKKNWGSSDVDAMKQQFRSVFGMSPDSIVLN